MTNNHATLPREMSADVNYCQKCAELEETIRFLAQRDYRRKMDAWAEYEKHRRECHHVLHVATAKGGR